MDSKLITALRKQKYYMTTDLRIFTYLGACGIIPYDTKPHKNNKNISVFFYGNSSKLRAKLYEYFDTAQTP